MRQRIIQQVTGDENLDFRHTFEEAVVTGSNALFAVNRDAAVKLGAQKENVQRLIQRRRQGKFPEPPVSSVVVFPEPWQHLCGVLNEPVFLLINESFPINGEPHSIIVLGLMSEFEFLCEQPTWFLDGTFEVAPNFFYQLFTIHYIYKGRCMPALFCLLTGKSQPLYTKLFNLLKSLAISNNIVVQTNCFMVDYEIAIRNALICVWPDKTVHGCWFHFCQAVYKKLVEFGFKVSNIYFKRLCSH